MSALQAMNADRQGKLLLYSYPLVCVELININKKGKLMEKPRWHGPSNLNDLVSASKSNLAPRKPWLDDDSHKTLALFASFLVALCVCISASWCASLTASNGLSDLALVLVAVVSAIITCVFLVSTLQKML